MRQQSQPPLSFSPGTPRISLARGAGKKEGGLPLKNPIPACFPAEKGGQDQMSCLPLSQLLGQSCSMTTKLFPLRAPLCEAHSAPSRLSTVHSLFHARHWVGTGFTQRILYACGCLVGISQNLKRVDRCESIWNGKAIRTSSHFSQANCVHQPAKD